MLDEYWLYSVFTLVLLLIFEATVTKSRLRNLGTLRQMAEQPEWAVMVFRARQWQAVSNGALLPGDIISVARRTKRRLQDGTLEERAPDSVVPCDCVLLSGSCVVNEAMLTGESTPKMKEAVSGNSSATYDVSEHRRGTLFAGTNVLQASAPTSPFGKGKDSIPPPPDGGVIAFVMRTGFETSQGKLLRTILFGTERITANSKEAFQFIFVLLMFAIAASAYVLVVGLQDDERSRWKLFLNW